MTFRGVIFRAVLYVSLAAIPVLQQGVYDVLQGNCKSSTIYWSWIAIAALYQALLALRAFSDGSWQRHQDQQSGTAFLRKP